MKNSLCMYFLAGLLATLTFSSCRVTRSAYAPEDVLLIADFEGETLKNNLLGESGSWNLTPDADDVDVRIEIVPGGSQGSAHSLKVEYDVASETPSNVGFWTKLMGLDARKYDHIAVDLKGDASAGFTQELVLEIKKYKDDERIQTIKGAAIVRDLSDDWQTVEIPLNLFTGLFDQTNPAVWKDPMLALTNFDEFVINLESRRVSQKTGVLYVDNIRLLRKGELGPTIMAVPEHHILKTEEKLEPLEYARFLIDRLRGFPKDTFVAKTFPAEDEAFLREVARDTWKFFDEIIDREHQLPLDTIQLSRESAFGPETWIGDYTNVTNIGLYLMAVVSAFDLEFITETDAIERISATLDTVERLDVHSSGFLYNYYDTTLAIPTSYFVSLVDSGWLDAGLYVVKNAFPEAFATRTQALLDRHNFSFFYDEVSQQMVHGYFSHLDVKSDYLYGSLYTEPRAISYIAIGRGDVPLEHWFRMVRTFPESYGWQNQIPLNRELKETLGYTYYGGYYEWKDMRFVPSWGGSMFEALMPFLIIDEVQYAPDGLGLNDKRHAEGQVRFGKEVMGYPVWGMSPSSVPEGGYSEFGASPLGSKGYKAGVVTPHATFLALEFVPEEAVRNARALIEQFPIYGPYGFYDAVNVETGRVAYKYLTLDQAMILIPINNYLNNGAIRKRFHADPINEKALQLLREEHFFG